MALAWSCLAELSLGNIELMEDAARSGTVLWEPINLLSTTASFLHTF
jgi:hypothetical protein